MSESLAMIGGCLLFAITYIMVFFTFCQQSLMYLFLAGVFTGLAVAVILIMLGVEPWGVIGCGGTGMGTY